MLAFLLIQSMISTQATKIHQCNFVGHNVFNNCSREDAHRKQTPLDNVNKNICNRTFQASRVKKQAFSYTIHYAINDTLHHCCGEYASLKIIKNYTFTSEINQTTIQSSDFVYPILGRYDQNDLYGHYFIPAFDLPKSYYFTQATSSTVMIKKIVKTCFNLWPLLTICLLCSVIAGFMVWAMETRTNDTEFPREFYIGIFEGFWWAFISMTTIGYGDKSPRTLFGRIIAIFWIIIGITFCSIFTASLTTEIIDIRIQSNTDMEGKVVGVLNNRLNDAYVAAQHGGIIKTVEYNFTSKGVGQLLMLLEEEIINGFLLNSQTYYEFLKLIKRDKYKKEAELFQRIHLVLSEVRHHGDRLTYGILVKHRKDYEYFRKFFENNWLHLQTCHNIKNNYKTKRMSIDETDLFSSEGGLFMPFLLYTLGILAFIFCFGCIYEIRKRYKSKSTIYSIQRK